MQADPGARLHYEHFATLQDPRVERTKRYALMDIVMVAILAVIAGADGWEDIEDFAEARRAWLATVLHRADGVPCADTFRRVFEAIDTRELQSCFIAWMRELAETLSGKLVPIDGKTARGSRKRGQGPLHLVSAWVAENALALGQLLTEDKSNAIVAIPKLLELLDVRGATVSIDAMGCRKAIAATIVDKGADYILALKDNQPTLHQDSAATGLSRTRSTGRWTSPSTKTDRTSAPRTAPRTSLRCARSRRSRPLKARPGRGGTDRNTLALVT
ncbi:MAG: ISAs1 family transposase [Polyangiaceae bacterium]